MGKAAGYSEQRIGLTGGAGGDDALDLAVGAWFKPVLV
ncbi:hypothetical protein ABIE13_000052 [Ottowia thiooxydans]|uniref:Uncharacterized protein n=1 Tax=Ottowia thiooxydans TaxID=219182 RepID=A0ABV2Q1Q2_9BURK